MIVYKEAFFDEDQGLLCIVMELADSGDLKSKIAKAKEMKQFIKETKIWHIFKYLLHGVEALHAANIVHRDIKSANIFLYKDGGVKLGDLNVSAIDSEKVMQTVTGTPYYCPPEVWRNEPYSSKCDIWSVGCVIYELTALKTPFWAKNIKDLQIKVKKGDYPPIPEHFSSNLDTLISCCLQVDPNQRLTATELLQHPAFCDVENIFPFADTIRRARSNDQQTCLKDSQFIDTIVLPNNPTALNQGLLPEK